MVFRVFLGIALAVLLYWLYLPSNDGHLEREQFDLPVTGKAMRTTEPLLPYTRYFIRISSPLSLRPFGREVFHWYHLGFSTDWQFTLDGAEYLGSSSEKGPNDRINHVIFEAQGIGEPLRIRTEGDFTANFNARTLSTVITRYRWWRHENGTDLRGVLVVGAILFYGLILMIPREERPHPVHPTRTLPAVATPLAQLPLPRHHQQFTLQPRKPCASPDPLPEGTRVVVTLEGLWVVSATSVKGVTNPDLTLYGVDAQYAGLCAKPVGAWQPHHKLFFDDAGEPAISFRHDRHHRYSFAYTGTGERLVLFLEVPHACADHRFWHHDAISVTVREMSAAERAELDAPAAVEDDRDLEEEKRQSYLDRIRVLKIEYDGRRYLDNDDWIEQYAQKHLDDLLRDRTRIIEEHRALHDDPDFVTLFTEIGPKLYTRATWEYRALCRAEELEPGDTTKRPKLTPEERNAKFARFRDRALERDRVQAEDRMAAVRQKLGLLQQFKDDIEAYDIDEDEQDRLIKEFEDDLFAPTEEDANGNFKQV